MFSSELTLLLLLMMMMMMMMMMWMNDDNDDDDDDWLILSLFPLLTRVIIEYILAPDPMLAIRSCPNGTL